MAKTQYSLSVDAKERGVPTGFIVLIKSVRAYIGAGILVAICGDIMTIPGLPIWPGFYDVDIDFETGRVKGLF